MKTIRILKLVTLGLTLTATSCNKFLDTLPDKRTELNNDQKVKALLVSAYPTMHRAGLIEHRTDNVQDNGLRYEEDDISVRQNYRWEWHTDTDWDTAQGLWEACYASIGSANQALLSIEQLGNPASLQAAKGEALLCRAWGHYLLVTTFSQAYNAQTSATDKGMPYFTEPERSINIQAKRLSVKETYERIEADLKVGYPLIKDSNYTPATLKYHFNQRAAAAFMADFYLSYEHWAEAKKYADIALGQNPTLRDLAGYQKFTGPSEYTYAYISAEEPANLMLQATRSLWGRTYNDRRYGHADVIARSQTYRSVFPGGSSLPVFDRLYYSGTPDPMVFFPKMEEIFEITNVLARTGQPHIVATPFTVDKSLLLRAEANVLLGQYDAALADLNLWYLSKGGRSATMEQVEQHYSIPTGQSEEEQAAAKNKLATIAKPLNPRFAKPLEEGRQYLLMQAVLHAKRVDAVHEGGRWDDIKRYGIEIKHALYDGTELTLTAHDARKALQIPANVITAGLEPNTY